MKCAGNKHDWYFGSCLRCKAQRCAAIKTSGPQAGYRCDCGAVPGSNYCGVHKQIALRKEREKTQ